MHINNQGNTATFEVRLTNFGYTREQAEQIEREVLRRFKQVIETDLSMKTLTLRVTGDFDQLMDRAFEIAVDLLKTRVTAFARDHVLSLGIVQPAPIPAIAVP